MKRYPSIPHVDDAPPDFFDGGHLWVQELVAGELFRFAVGPTGALQVGTRRSEFEPGEAPPRFRHAVRHVRDSLDRDALAGAGEAVESAVFFGVATHYDGVPYDWARTPSVLGIDVWDASREEFLAVDTAERAFAALGLDPVNALAKEVHVRDFDVDPPEPPASAWYDGPAAGVVLRKKTGERCSRPNPGAYAQAPGVGGVAVDPAVVAADCATQVRFERIATTVRELGRPVTFDTVYDRICDAIYRTDHHRLFEDDRASGVDELDGFRDEVAARTREFLDDNT